jgi:hypothetical protein
MQWVSVSIRGPKVQPRPQEKEEAEMPKHDPPLNDGNFFTLDVRHMSDSVEKLSMVTAEVAKQVRNEMAGKEPPNVVVFISGGRIQNIIADTLVEAYVVECEMPEENNRKENISEICGLPVIVSKRDNRISPRLVKEVAQARRHEGE